MQVAAIVRPGMSQASIIIYNDGGGSDGGSCLHTIFTEPNGIRSYGMTLKRLRSTIKKAKRGCTVSCELARKSGCCNFLFSN